MLVDFARAENGITSMGLNLFAVWTRLKAQDSSEESITKLA